MAPLTVYIIRHAEKPIGKKGETDAILGVDPDGNHDSHNLIVQGWQRAGGLAELFAHQPGNTPLRAGIAQPDAIYATAFILSADTGDSDTDGGEDSKSRRPQSTVTPLYQKLGVALNTTYSEGEEPALAADVMARSGTVLICWHHGHIPNLATDIGGSGLGIPTTWPSQRFDMIWVLGRDASGAWAFSQLPQYLLPGDKPI